MSLTDNVAQFIASNTNVMPVPQGLTRDDMKREVKRFAKCSNPQKTISIGYEVNVGDVFKPHRVCAFTTSAGDTDVLLPSNRYIILQLGYKSKIYSMLNDDNLPDNTETVSSVVVVCPVNKYNKPDIEVIKSVLLYRRHTELLSLLSKCVLMGNISDDL